MKKIISIFLCLSMLFLSSGCSSKNEENGENVESDYIVVKVEDNDKIDEIFNFSSIERTNITNFSDADVKEGVYSIGHLSNGNSVIWFSSDDGYGYDDCLFIYVKDNLNTSSIMHYASKLKEEPISYNDFLNDNKEFNQNSSSNIYRYVAKNNR